jgi:hypothetical protein
MDMSGICPFSWEEKLVMHLIAAPNVDRAIEDKMIGKKLRYRLHMKFTLAERNHYSFLQTNWMKS